MFVLRMALRNIRRNTRRTLLSVSVVVAGVWVVVVGNGFTQGMRENVIHAQVDSLSGHVLVRPADYPTYGLTHPLDHLIEVDDELSSWLDDNAQAWTTRTVFAVTAVSGADAMRARAFAFDPVTDEGVFPRRTWKYDGEIPTTAEDGVFLSRGLARLLQLSTGDRVVLKARTAAGALNALDVPIAGVYSTGNPALDAVGMFVPEPLADDLIRTAGARSHVLVRLSNRARTTAFAADLRTRVPEGTEVSTWIDESSDLMWVVNLRQRILNWFVGILLLLAALGILNTVLMAAYERIREVGTLRSMGMTRPVVVVLFVVEGALMGLIGGLVGASVGAAMTRYWSVNGIDLSAQLESGAFGEMPVSVMLYTGWQPEMVVLAVVYGVVVAALASVYPAWVASRMPPAEAVRAE